MRTITVRVDQSDIEHGDRGICSTCPLALAINRALRNEGHELYANVGHDEVDICNIFGKWLVGSIKLPKEVAAWVVRFDAKLPVQPFTIDLEVPIAA